MLAVQMVDELYHHVFGVINVAPLLFSKRLATIVLTGNPDGYTLYCGLIEKKTAKKNETFINARDFHMHVDWMVHRALLQLSAVSIKGNNGQSFMRRNEE